MVDNCINRRDFLKKTFNSCMALSPFLFYFNCKKSDEQLKIGYIPITDASPLLIAYANGYFKEEGLKSNTPVLIRSWSSLVEAFLADKINIAHFLIPIPLWMRYNNNSLIKIIAWNHTNGSALTVNPDLNINGFEDLGGKQIAVPYWYSMHNIILQMGLRKFGINPVIKSQSVKLKKNESNLFILPPPEMPSALAGRKIDAYIVAEPFNALGELKIKAKIMRFTGDIWKNHPCCVIVMKEKLIKSNPVFTQKAVNAIVRAQSWIINNREETALILSNEGKGFLPVDNRTTRLVFSGYELEKYGINNKPLAIKHPEWKMKRINFMPYPYPSAIEFIFEQMKLTLVEGDKSFLKKYESSFIAKDIIEDKFVKNAINNLGGVKIFPEMNLDSPWKRSETIEI